MTITIDEITATRNSGALGGWADVEVLGSELSGGRLLSGVVLSFTPDTAKGFYSLSATIDSGAASVEIEQLAGTSYAIDSRNEAKLNRPGFRSYREAYPARASEGDSWPA
ncbi:hypothetical protein [Leucobacter soli]|uniref:Uncharacterized protein n=2 Tax=Leucobacter soli TaxID=2812850 RepID=A0A916JXC1_9MICO|nr:hypothetical protein LEUCIP111803_01613 [Leucobacter soli]